MLFALVGVVAAFAVASIHALPLALNAVGFEMAWIEDLGRTAAPYRSLLLYIGAASLAAGGVLLWFEQQAVHESYATDMDSSLTVRTTAFIGLMLGVALLLAGNCFA